MTDRRRRPQRGFTLIEMVLVIGAVTIVLGLCAAILSGLFKINRAGQATVLDATTLARLARQFRQDARVMAAAKPLDARPAGPGLVLSEPGGASFVYRVEGRRLVREVRSGDEVRARESFAAERLGPVTFGVDGSRAWMALARRPGAGPALPRPGVRVEARVGKDRELGDTTGARK